MTEHNPTISDGTPLEDAWFYTHRQKLHDEFERSSKTADRSYRTEVDELENRIRLAERERKTQESRDLAIQLAQLRELHALKQTATEREREEAKRYEANVRRAYALWRQTPDGAFFTDWLKQAREIHGRYTATLSGWDDLYRKEALAAIPEEEKRREQSRVWVDRPTMTKAFWIILTIAVVGIVASVITQFLHESYFITTSLRDAVLAPAMICGLFGAIGAAIVGIRTKRSKQWRQDNTAAALSAHQARVKKFGFDPLGSAPPPSLFVGNYRAYLDRLNAVAVEGYETHPSPEELPKLSHPVLRDSADIPFTPMAEWLARNR